MPKPTRMTAIAQKESGFIRNSFLPLPGKRQKQRHKMKENFVMMFQKAFVEIAKDRDLRGEAGSILNYLLGKMDYENFVCIEQRVIAADLGIHRTNVSVAMKLLVKKGILIKGAKIGRNASYRINWEYAWRGSAESLTETKTKTVLKAIKGGKK